MSILPLGELYRLSSRQVSERHQQLMYYVLKTAIVKLLVNQLNKKRYLPRSLSTVSRFRLPRVYIAQFLGALAAEEEDSKSPQVPFASVVLRTNFAAVELR